METICFNITIHFHVSCCQCLIEYVLYSRLANLTGNNVLCNIDVASFYRNKSFSKYSCRPQLLHSLTTIPHYVCFTKIIYEN